MQMKHRSRVAQRIVVSLVAIGMAISVHAGQVKSDNSATNKSDRKAGAVTADQQKNNQSDLETSRQIRRAIMADKSLSTYAHNIKIVTQQGKVTLRGPVRTEAEKETVQAKATEVAGAANVTSAITVVPTKSRKPKTS
jgi:hyperosmotically inducible periplasmic protein